MRNTEIIIRQELKEIKEELKQAKIELAKALALVAEIKSDIAHQISSTENHSER
jgi:phage shock protein A